MIDEEDRIQIAAQPAIGADISRLSVDDLTDRIAVLAGEIKRCEDALEGRKASKAAADAVFGNLS